MELDYRAIGKRIKIARIQANLKQEKLAEIIEKRYIFLVERRKRYIRTHGSYRFSAFFSLT